MNEISQNQNKVEFIDLLKAQRIAYSKCKKYLICDLVSVFIAIILPLLGLIENDLVRPLGAVGFIWTVIYLITELYKKKLTTIAAKIQEEFDTELFNLHWNKMLCKNKINQDTRHDLSIEYHKDDLKNWYSVEIDNTLPHNIAVILCQRTNFSWELSLRKRFTKFLLASVTLYYGAIIIVSILLNTGIYDMLILLVPSLSFLIYAVKNIYSLINQIHTKQDTLENIDSYLEIYSKSKVEPNIELLRQIQDVIYIERSAPEKIPDWFYKIFKDSNEIKTDELIKNFKTKLLCQS